jgi:hypothetical protein
MIMAREALSRIIALGRPVREAASFLADKCYHLELHGWAYVNSDDLQPVPHEIWPALMWSSLPDDEGLISDIGGNLRIAGDWFAGRIGYLPKEVGPLSKRYLIQGMRFDRDEFEALLPEKVLTWYCEPIGAKPLIASAAERMGSPDSDRPGIGGSAEKCPSDLKARKRKPGPAPDPAWPEVVARIVKECILAGYRHPLRRGNKAAIATMLLSAMAEQNKHFSEDTAAKYALEVIEALPGNKG